jgi:cytochrome c biogenesis protein CcmG, thiol:disulfide interchange protein DsbE
MSSVFSDQPVTRGRGPNGWSILVFMGLGMLVGVLFLSWLGTPRIVPAIGQPLARLELTPLAFTDKQLSEADLQGKITVLHFWGTWCPHCMTEFPEFTKMADDLKAKDGLQVLSVASSEGPEYDIEKLTAEIRDYLKEQGAEMPTYADPAGLTRGQAAMLMPDTALAYPCTLVLDREGIVRGTWTGYRPGNMEQAKQKALQLWNELSLEK